MINRFIFIYILLLFGFVSHAQTLAIGDIAPEIVQKSLTGEEMSLSSLQGKMVLIDFWASWCAPCRKENPLIVEAYKKYADESFDNGEGFTIFSVSLDVKKEAWEAAVKADNLIWPYHVSDLKGWRNEVAKLYNVRQVPTSYLIDGNGVIVGVNLRGDALEKKLKKLRKRSWFAFW